MQQKTGYCVETCFSLNRERTKHVKEWEYLVKKIMHKYIWFSLRLRVRLNHSNAAIKKDFKILFSILINFNALKFFNLLFILTQCLHVWNRADLPRSNGFCQYSGCWILPDGRFYCYGLKNSQKQMSRCYYGVRFVS